MEENETKRKSQFSGDVAREIETKPGCTKVGFIDNEGTYHVFHDVSILRSKSYTEDGIETLQIEVGEYLVIATGYRLNQLNALLHDYELYRATPSPKERLGDYKSKKLAYFDNIIVGQVADPEEDANDSGTQGDMFDS